MMDRGGECCSVEYMDCRGFCYGNYTEALDVSTGSYPVCCLKSVSVCSVILNRPLIVMEYVEVPQLLIPVVYVVMVSRDMFLTVTWIVWVCALVTILRNVI